MLLGRAVLAGMRKNGAGRIVQIDSEVVHRPPPGRSADVTVRHHRQLGVAGLRPVERQVDVPDETRSAYVDSVPAGRIGLRGHRPRGQLLRLEAAGFSTGQRLVVDGGRAVA